MPIPLGVILGALGSVAGASASSAISTASANRQMRFQERMRNTQYQAAVNDMRLAGLNPMLAYQQGGAASPAGASFDAGPIDAVSSAVDAIRSSREGRRLSEELKLIKAQADAQSAQAGAARAQSLKTLADKDVVQSGAFGRFFGSTMGSLFSRSVRATASAADAGVDRMLEQVRYLERLQEERQRVANEEGRRRRRSVVQTLQSVPRALGRFFSGSARRVKHGGKLPTK